MRLLFVVLFSSQMIVAQELNLGGNIGLGRIESYNVGLSGVQLEYIPKLDKVSISLNTEVSVLFLGEDLLMSSPLYLKMVFGRKCRVSPYLGMFVRSNGYYGPTFGGMVDIQLKSRMLLSFKVDRNIDIYKASVPSHIGGSTEYNTFASTWFSIGLRRNLLKKNRSQGMQPTI